MEKINEDIVKIDCGKLLECLKEKNMSQRDLCKELGKGHNFINSCIRKGYMLKIDEKFMCLVLGEIPGTFVLKEPHPISESSNQESNTVDTTEILRALSIVHKDVVAIKKILEPIGDDLENIRNKVQANSTKLMKMNEKLNQLTESELDKAVRFLKDELASGRQNAEAIKLRAETANIKESDLLKAKSIVGALTDTPGYGKNAKTYWYLPRN